MEDPRLKFYEKQINRINFTISKINEKGVDYLHEIDKSKGVEWALLKLNQQKQYFRNQIQKINQRLKRPNKSRIPLNFCKEVKTNDNYRI